jgi:L-fucose isomerase-like protein
MKKLKVGFAAGFMDGFSTVGLDLFARYRKELDRMSESLGIETVHFEKPMLTVKEAKRIRTELDEREVDFLLLFIPAYIIGDQVYEVMKARAAVGLWAIAEPRDEGPMPLASFVNLSQNASIARNYFKGGGRKAKWFFGPMDGPLFKPRFDITVRVLRAIKNLRDARVAQIGKLEETTDRKSIGVSKIEDSVRMYLAIRDICEHEDYRAVAFSCWPKLMPLKGMTGCLVNALLNNAGYPAGCEADVLSTVSMLLLHYLTGKSTVVMDLPSFDTGDNTLQLWHCGTSPFDMADAGGVKLEHHYFADYTSDERLKDVGPVTDVVFRQADVTVFRITGESDCFYYFTGRTFNEGKKTFNGSRGWVRDLHFNGEPVEVLDLVNTMLVNGLPHHYPVVLEDVGGCLEELAYWLELKRVRKVPYRDYLYVPGRR